MDNKMIGTFISISRHENGWTQSEFAKSLNVSNKTVSKWETGRGLPDVAMFPIIAKVLDVTVAELMQGYKDIKDDKLELIKISDMETVDLIESMSAIQYKTIKKRIFKSICANIIRIIAKIVAVTSMVAILVVGILFGTGVIRTNDVQITPNEEDFECLFFAKEEPLKKEYNMNGMVSLNFDFAVRNKKGANYSANKPIIDVGEINWYRSNIFYYTVEYNNGGKFDVFVGKTGTNKPIGIGRNFNYINNNINLTMAGTYEITGYCEFLINDKTFKYSDSITIKVNPINDKLLGSYADTPKFATNGYIISTNNTVYWGEEIANYSGFSHTTIEEQHAYGALLTGQGYTSRIIGDNNKMYVYENYKYSIYLFSDKLEQHIFYRYVVNKTSVPPPAMENLSKNI